MFASVRGTNSLVFANSRHDVEVYSAALVQNKQAEKYDRYLGDDLLNAEYAAKQLDPAGAWRVLERVAHELDAHDVA